MMRALTFALAMIVNAVLGLAASAQNYSVTSVSAANLGNVAAAASGQTIFNAAASTGTVTKLLGNGVRLSSGSVRSLVTVACGNQNACDTSNALVAITTTGTPTGRAAALQNFTISVSGATASIVTGPGTGSSISFTIGPVPRNGSRTFYVGYDVPINGDNTSGTTGSASSGLVVTISRPAGAGSGSGSGSVTASTFRAIAISRAAHLSFGRVTLPTSGSATVSLAPATSVVTVTGTGIAKLNGITPTAAQFGVTGEGGQAVTVSVPATITMAGSGPNITVTTSATGSGVQTLSGALGAAGTLTVRVGGSFPLTSTTASGSYSGTFTVTVAYN